LNNRRLPGFCVLDPEGLELDWTTIATCAGWRRGAAPYELLIYFSTPGAARTAGVQQTGWVEAAERRLTRLFGTTTWKDIAERQRGGILEPGAAGRGYLDAYKAQLRDLGYSTVLDRPAISSSGTLVYHLVFATANAAGANIMRQAMDRAYSGQLPFQL
jgi:three-Cys-motif partner protein